MIQLRLLESIFGGRTSLPKGGAAISQDIRW